MKKDGGGRDKQVKYNCLHSCGALCDKVQSLPITNSVIMKGVSFLISI